jgi:hypothetical protein
MARAKKTDPTSVEFSDMQIAVLRDNHSHVNEASSRMAPFQIALNTATQHLEDNVRKFLVEQGGEEMHNMIEAGRVSVDDKTLAVTIKPVEDEAEVVGEPEEDAEDAAP